MSVFSDFWMAVLLCGKDLSFKIHIKVLIFGDKKDSFLVTITKWFREKLV